MTEATLIFPHQLFKEHPALQKGRPIYIIEEWLFFRQYNFNKQKLILHRASMKFYEEYLNKYTYEVRYIETQDERNDVRILIASLARKGVLKIHFAEVADTWLMKRISDSCEEYKIELVIYTAPSFLTTQDEVTNYFNKHKTYFQTDFYKDRRKQQKLLLEKDGKPVGGKWTFDDENRLKFPKKEVVPALHFPKINKHLPEATAYVQKHFGANYGSAAAPHYFAITFNDAEDWLNDFIHSRFQKFGDYEDAIVAKENVLHHSVLSPMLNAGLLTPQQVINAILKGATKYKVPINSLEGFIRQVVGWREFVRIVYEREGTKQRTTNYWKFSRKIPKSFWDGTTGIAPIDITIKKVLKTGYCHHIERLMVLGNFMLLCEFDPDEVYRWFMELFVDAYDWVMVPNVYGMTQFADGGLMTSKPYISGSNYLMKMSDYEKGEWQPIWDGLFWRFMHVHRDFFLKNPRLGMLIGTFDKFTAEKRAMHLATAENYLSGL